MTMMVSAPPLVPACRSLRQTGHPRLALSADGGLQQSPPDIRLRASAAPQRLDNLRLAPTGRIFARVSIWIRPGFSTDWHHAWMSSRPPWSTRRHSVCISRRSGAFAFCSILSRRLFNLRRLSSSARYKLLPWTGLIEPRTKRSPATARPISNSSQLLPIFGLPARTVSPSGINSGTTILTGANCSVCSVPAVIRPSRHDLAGCSVGLPVSSWCQPLRRRHRKSRYRASARRNICNCS
jgi:hypothetical protein